MLIRKAAERANRVPAGANEELLSSCFTKWTTCSN